MATDDKNTERLSIDLEKAKLELIDDISVSDDDGILINQFHQLERNMSLIELEDEKSHTALLQTTPSNKLKTNFAALKQLPDECKKISPVIPNCKYLQRLVIGLQYYSTLDIQHSELNKHEFSRFCNDTYKKYLSDFIHLIDVHNDDLEDIIFELYKQYGFKICDVNTCSLSTRHRRRIRGRKTKVDEKPNVNQKQTSVTDPLTEFYIETYDNLHFYLLHLFDVGLRMTKSQSFEDSKSNDGKQVKFTKMSKVIKKSKDYTPLEEMSTNKFNIDIIDHGKNIEDDKESIVSLVFKYLQQLGVESTEMKKLNTFLEDEEYDSDAVEYDCQNITKGNIVKQFQNGFVVQQYFTMRKLSSSAFKNGIIYYYWPYYRLKANGQDEAMSEANVNDHGGFDVSMLYVSQRYSTFKEEILNYNTQYMEQQNFNVAMKKACAYVHTPKTKQTISTENIHLHYDVPVGKSLGIWNIISLILYCDFSELSAEFSSTFRPSYYGETLSSIKKRNQNYWWLSKTLRETVQYFGDNWYNNDVVGPFYCGMSSVMIITEFNIRLGSPNSTSKHLEVATRFAGEEGMLLQLNNNGDRYSKWNLRCFNCSWVSRYKEEDERLFIGGDWRIRIESITLITTAEGFETFFKAFFYFDSMVNGSFMDRNDMDIDSSDKAILSSLIKHLTEEKPLDNRFPSYIVNTFKAFCLNKTQIVINLNYLNLYFKELSHLVMYGVVKDVYGSNYNMKYSKKNALHPNLFKLFTKLTRIIIFSTSSGGDVTFSFSLKKLISTIKACHENNDFPHALNEIQIKATWPYPNYNAGERSWLFGFYNSPSAWSVKSQLSKDNWNMLLKVTKNGNNRDCLIMKKNY